MMQGDDRQMVRTEQNGDTITISPAESSGMFGRPVDLDITVPRTINLELRTSSGDINVDGVNGQLTLASNSGEIKGSNITGAFNISTNSGDVKLENSTLRGENNFRSDSGKIEFQGSLDPQGSYQFQTNSGDVKVKLPPGSSFHLTHTTNNGDLENEFPQAENKDALGPLLNIITNSGDISVKSDD
jgi:DUF4097 and DUF4098 domain-containing protein YvlB